jgi:Co/Zn/Cd efflux system component
MSFIERLQKKPHNQKVRILWISTISVFVLLVGAWVLTSKISENSQKDTTLFKTLKDGFKDVKETYGQQK